MSSSTVSISLEIATRLKQLAADRSRKLGLPRILSQRDYVEMLINEEEKRTQDAAA